MTSRESVARAQTSGNLGEKPDGEVGDVDIIRACGMSGHSNPMGLAVWRWRYSGARGELARVAVALVDRGYEPDVVARVMGHMMDDVCPICHGRGRGTMKNAPVLTADICVECEGTGRKILLGEKERALVEVIAAFERDVISDIRRRLE